MKKEPTTFAVVLAPPIGRQVTARPRSAPPTTSDAQAPYSRSTRATTTASGERRTGPSRWQDSVGSGRNRENTPELECESVRGSNEPAALRPGESLQRSGGETFVGLKFVFKCCERAREGERELTGWNLKTFARSAARAVSRLVSYLVGCLVKLSVV